MGEQRRSRRKPGTRYWRTLARLEVDQSTAGMALFAAEDVFRWLENLRRRGQITREQHDAIDRLVREMVRGLALHRRCLEWIRWGRRIWEEDEDEQFDEGPGGWPG